MITATRRASNPRTAHWTIWPTPRRDQRPHLTLCRCRRGADHTPWLDAPTVRLRVVTAS